MGTIGDPIDENNTNMVSSVFLIQIRQALQTDVDIIKFWQPLSSRYNHLTWKQYICVSP